jgi:hypothetical protein
MEIMRLASLIRDKVGWSTKVLQKDIVAKWRAEVAEQAAAAVGKLSGSPPPKKKGPAAAAAADAKDEIKTEADARVAKTMAIFDYLVQELQFIAKQCEVIMN